MIIVISFIQVISKCFIWVVVVNSLLSYFLQPFHPIREALDKVIEPLLCPIRKVIKPVNGIDFSPLVLILLVYLLEFLFTQLLWVFIL